MSLFGAQCSRSPSASVWARLRSLVAVPAILGLSCSCGVRQPETKPAATTPDAAPAPRPAGQASEESPAAGGEAPEATPQASEPVPEEAGAAPTGGDPPPGGPKDDDSR